jgi:NitT/TauT family transport system permease protein
MKIKKAVEWILVLLFWLAVWQVAAILAGSVHLIPDPITVLDRLGELAGEADFWRTCVTSLGRILLGVVIAVVIAIPPAILTAFSPLADRLFSPLLTVVKSTPVASFIILALVFLGRNTVPVFIAILMVTPVVWGNVSAGIRATDKELLAMCRAYGVPRARVLRGAYLPSAVPYFLSAVRTSLGLAWKAGIAAEVLTSAKNSIGKEIFEAKQYMETVNLFAWTLVVIILSLAIEKLVLAMLDRLGGRVRKEVSHAERA